MNPCNCGHAESFHSPTCQVPLCFCTRFEQAKHQDYAEQKNAEHAAHTAKTLKAAVQRWMRRHRKEREPSVVELLLELEQAADLERVRRRSARAAFNILQDRVQAG